jgi:branched-chain amino acid transport system permease protein
MTTLWSGLSDGALYALVGVGYNIVLLASGVFNFANAQLIMLGTYLAYFAAVTLKLPLVPTVLIGAAAVALIAVAEERLAIRPLMGRRDSHATLITSVGVAVALDGIVLRIWGSQPKSVPAPLSSKPLNLLGGTIEPTALLLIVLVIVVGVGLHILSKKTMIGLGSLASAEDRDAAMARGVNVRALAIGAFALAGLIAGAFGVVVGSGTYANPGLGDNLALFGFVAIAIGGSGSQIGSLIGGFATGIIYAEVSRYTNADWPQIVVFALFLLILLTRPRGLFGGAVERQV